MVNYSALAGMTIKSLLNRKFTVLLTIAAIALSTALWIGVERVRTQSKAAFANTISGTDIIVGARAGDVQLLLYSVFRIGDASNNISWQSYQRYANHRSVKWAVPLSLGDSHKGYRVIGTIPSYFTHYRYADKKPLMFAQGEAFSGKQTVVLGSEVAKSLGYQLGDKINLAHGTGNTSFKIHDAFPFEIVGVLEPTGTPVDRSLHVPLLGLELVHGNELATEPNQVTAFLLGLTSRIQVLRLQRQINTDQQEALSAIMPAVALRSLWKMMGVAERALVAVSGLVVLVGFIGMLTTMLAGLNERRRELAILRAMGARPLHLLMMINLEAVIITGSAIVLGISLLYMTLFALQPMMMTWFGLYLPVTAIAEQEYKLLAIVLLAGVLSGLFPALRAYLQSVQDGMSVKV